MSEVIHYGPVWDQLHREPGESYAACAPGAEVPPPNTGRTLTTHRPWVTCEACKVILRATDKNVMQPAK